MIMKYSIALTPYLNTRPFFYHQVPDDFELVAMSPRESVQAIESGRAIAGIVPIAGLKQLEDYIDFPGEFGIASEGPVHSVLFFSSRPFAAFTRNCNISLTSESLTSIQLLSLLFVYQLGQADLPGVIADGTANVHAPTLGSDLGDAIAIVIDIRRDEVGFSARCRIRDLHLHATNSVGVIDFLLEPNVVEAGHAGRIADRFVDHTSLIVTAYDSVGNHVDVQTIEISNGVLVI